MARVPITKHLHKLSAKHNASVRMSAGRCSEKACSFNSIRLELKQGVKAIYQPFYLAFVTTPKGLIEAQPTLHLMLTLKQQIPQCSMGKHYHLH
ncbi:MAG: hypothetical protein EBX37_19040 [Alphaproteobacteria bacterium]|nr:hypothetical protein [Alphaproteobacteria bacterium]